MIKKVLMAAMLAGAGMPVSAAVVIQYQFLAVGYGEIYHFDRENPEKSYWESGRAQVSFTVDVEPHIFEDDRIFVGGPLQGTLGISGDTFTAWVDSLESPIQISLKAIMPSKVMGDTLPIINGSPPISSFLTVTRGLGNDEFEGKIWRVTSRYMDVINPRINYSISFVPEPTSWALMIAGFGLVGAALRGRARSALA